MVRLVRALGLLLWQSTFLLSTLVTLSIILTAYTATVNTVHGGTAIGTTMSTLSTNSVPTPFRTKPVIVGLEVAAILASGICLLSVLISSYLSCHYSLPVRFRLRVVVWTAIIVSVVLYVMSKVLAGIMIGQSDVVAEKVAQHTGQAWLHNRAQYIWSFCYLACETVVSLCLLLTGLYLYSGRGYIIDYPGSFSESM